MKKTILVDLGVITEYLKTGKGLLPQAYEIYKMQITASTYAELLASKTFQDKNLEKEVVEFIHKYFEVISVTEAMAGSAAQIIRDYEVSFATALLAGAAKELSLQLLTDVASTFEKIEGVSVLKM